MAVLVREVWAHNLNHECDLLHKILFHFPFVSMDTEFPGTVFHPTHIPPHAMSSLPPSLYYEIMKKNVDELNLIQLGLTLFDHEGNLPVDFSTGFPCIWQFNFRDFDPDRHPHNPESISLLVRQGIDFSKNKKQGIDSGVFAHLFKEFVLSMNFVRVGSLTRTTKWVTFHGTNDFGYLIKILTGRKLPEDLEDFMLLIQTFFGESVYDVKPMARVVGLHGGLDRIAETLELVRPAGKSHQAGSDSLLTMQVFVEVMKMYDANQSLYHSEEFNQKICGLA